jgi:hypothetical protein
VYVHRLRHRFKWAFFALQSWAFVEHGRYVSRLGDLLEIVPTPDDREVLRVVCDWHLLEDDRNARPLYYMQLLERWSRGMMARIGERERRLPPSETPDRESAA